MGRCMPTDAGYRTYIAKGGFCNTRRYMEELPPYVAQSENRFVHARFVGEDRAVRPGTSATCLCGTTVPSTGTDRPSMNVVHDIPFMSPPGSHSSMIQWASISQENSRSSLYSCNVGFHLKES